MPGKKHLRGVGAKEQREYEHIKRVQSDPAVTASAQKKLPPER